ncbi:PIN domain-containing protein [Pedobacter sp.]|jgi:hypothetical protein|uniref:PIN domain-containing protein n=1 Tax=Pedobacter sp. TaxID=1411316 RepID=UPI002C12D235|nr:PIN domain-containing protein [Pedobacter sp.]HWW37907.1 PIN domain-containing protein [Pedobacter sp.]
MVLQSRNLVIDTQYFVSRSFDFSSKEINALKELVKKSLVHVYLTDINDREIKKKIVDVTTTAFAKIHTSDVRILKHIPLYGQFLKTYNLEKSIQYFYSAFEKFKVECEVNIISSDKIKAIRIFEDYCNQRPPFNTNQQKNRKGEFPDAFALAAIEQYFENQDAKAYLLSGDSDWQQFATASYILPFGDDEVRFNCLTELSGLLDLVLRNYEATNDLSKFADQLFKDNSPQISDFIIDLLNAAEFEIIALDHDVSLSRQAAKSVTLINKELIEVFIDRASYNILIEAEVVLQYQVADYGNSSKIPDNSMNFYLSYEPRLRLHKVKFNAEIEISYNESVPGNFQITNGEINSIIEIVFEEGIELDHIKWMENLPVVIVGVEKGKITQDGGGSQRFENIKEARMVFPELNLTASSTLFTNPMGNKMTGELRFETWKANEQYSD